MAEERVQELKALQEQMVALRNDSSLLTGVTFTTLAGDIHIARKEVAVSLIDCLIKDIKDEIKYQER